MIGADESAILGYLDQAAGIFARAGRQQELLLVDTRACLLQSLPLEIGTYFTLTTNNL